MMECLSTEFHNDYSRHKEVLYLSSFKKKNQLKTDRKKKVVELIINCETKTRSSASSTYRFYEPFPKARKLQH